MKQLSLLYEMFSKMRSISSAFLTSIILRIVTLQSTSAALQIVLTNDDGWAVANIRAQFNALSNAGYDVVLSSPAVDQSGTGSLEAPAVPVVLGCEFDSCPPLSPATGSDASNALLNYYNSFPASAVNFGITTLAPRFFGKAPDLIVSGPNVGSNTGISVLGSGTVGAASKAALDGIPSIAFSGSSGSQVSFTTLTNATDPNTVSAQVYAALTVQLTGTLLASPAPILPPGVSLNVNYPAISDTCSDPSAFSFVLTRIFEDPLVEDVETCGSDHLPTEGDVIAEAGCKTSVSVFDASTKLDANIANQTIVLEKLASLLTCA